MLPFEKAQPVYVGARAIGVGNAFTAIADDASACFWNPAGLIQSQGVRIFGMNKFLAALSMDLIPKGFLIHTGRPVSLGEIRLLLGQEVKIQTTPTMLSLGNLALT